MWLTKTNAFEAWKFSYTMVDLAPLDSQEKRGLKDNGACVPQFYYQNISSI